MDLPARRVDVEGIRIPNQRAQAFLQNAAAFHFASESVRATVCCGNQ